MLEWLGDYGALAEVAAARAQLDERVGRLEAAARQYQDQLRAALDEPGEPHALQAEARRRLSTESARRARHEQLERALGDGREALAEVAARLAGSESELSRWRDRFGEVLAGLGLSPSLEVAAALRIVDGLTAARRDLEALRLDEERAARRARSLARYRDQAGALLARIAPELAAQPPPQAVRELHERAERSARAAERRADLSRDAADLARELAEYGRLRRERDGELAEWRRRAGSSDDAAFLAAAAAARRAHELKQEIERAERALAEARGAVGEAEFQAALASAGRALVEVEAAELERSRRALEAEYDAAREEVGELRARLLPLDGSSRANALSAAIEARRAELRDRAREHATLTLARALLERQVRRFQEQNQPELLEAVSRLFADMTAGRYLRVYQRLDEEGTFVAVRANGGEVAPAGMSTGTREQLYLAIRLAYVGKYCERAEPLPVVLDDVLVNFDERRAAGALRVMGALAGQTQMILMTCHRHVAELAGRVLPSCRTVELVG
jgi:uncharacterized protein YhaN